MELTRFRERPQAFAGGVVHAQDTIVQLDQALDNQPLLPTFFYRERLEAVRRQASVDGHGIDPWHLAAVLEGMRLRVPDYPGVRIIDRCQVFEAARTALGLHQWKVEPDFDQEGEMQAAERQPFASGGWCRQAMPPRTGWREAAAARRSAARWCGTGGPSLLRSPVPLTGTRALTAEPPQERPDWVAAFLELLAAEASDFLELLHQMQHGCLDARRLARGRRSTSRAALAIDVLAVAPLVSATTLAGVIGMSIKCAGDLLDRFAAERMAVEVTHRSARRLFGLADVSLVPDVTTETRRLMPG